MKNITFNELIAICYSVTYERLCVIGMGYLCSWILVEDAIQNTFIKLIIMDEDKFLKIKNLEAYTITTFKNECRSILKKSKNPIVLTDDIESIIQKVASSDNNVANFESVNSFDNYLKSLSKEQYDVIHLRLTGLDDEKIAQKLGISIAALKQRTLRAKRKYFKTLK